MAGSSGKGAGPSAAGPSVADEKAALEASGKYYKQGEGPPLELLGDAWIGFFMYAQTTSGKELRCSEIGNDGYFETARCALEFAFTVRFDYEKLKHKGGVLNAVVIGQEHLAKRMIRSGLQFRLEGWFDPSEVGPPGFQAKGQELDL